MGTKEKEARSVAREMLLLEDWLRNDDIPKDTETFIKYERRVGELSNMFYADKNHILYYTPREGELSDYRAVVGEVRRELEHELGRQLH